MRTIFALLLFSSLSFAQSGDLVKVDELTPKEVKLLQIVQAEVADAQADLARTRAAIAKEHDMANQDWMEWGEWFDIQGNYILQYRVDHMQNFTTTPYNVVPVGDTVPIPAVINTKLPQ